MISVGAFEAKTHFSGLLEKVQAGEQIIVTKHGHPVAKIVPFETSEIDDLHAVATAIRNFRKQHKLSLRGLDWKTLRDEGRR